MEQRFWDKVKKSEGCWNWIASKTCGGYGKFQTLGKFTDAHRMSWMLIRGPIPQGLHVCHTCDNTLCVNPDHLFLGTAKDNAQDKKAKGRQNPGEKHHNAKLTEQDIRKIRCMEGSHQSIADRFGVCRQNITDIKNGKIWRCVT